MLLDATAAELLLKRQVFEQNFEPILKISSFNTQDII